MRRRTFLKWSAAGTAAAAVPAWIGSCRGPGQAQDVWREGTHNDVLAAYRAGHSAGKPVLVLIVREDDWEWGHAWGEALNLGQAELLADLALCEVVCARVSDVHDALPGFPGLPKLETQPPVALLLETDRAQSAWVAGTIVDLPSSSWGDEGTEYEQAVMTRVAALAAGVRAAVAPDLAAIERRAAQAAGAQGFDPPVDALRHSELSNSAPAIVRAAGESSPERRARAIAMLAGAAVAHLRDAPPRGAYWASSSGCGYDIEDGPEQRLGIACGMGHVPAISQRFLLLTTQAYG